MISRRATLPAEYAVAGMAATFTSVYLSAGALMPLLVTYKNRWDLSAAVITLTFAVFAVGFLVAVLTLGSLSDHVGRRPVLLTAMLIQLTANLMFLYGESIGWVMAARIVQGFATGAATAAFTAALIELAPPHRKRVGAILGSIGLTGGLAAGSLLAGLAIQFTTDANTKVFTVLTALTILGLVVVALTPETAARVPGALRSLIPRLAIPPVARSEFAAAAPAIAAIWMMSGLSGGLAPSLVRSVFQLDSGLLDGLCGFVAPAASAVTGVLFARVALRRAMTIGIYATILGAIAIVAGVAANSAAVMISGQAVAGAGFGAAFTAALGLIAPLVAGPERAGAIAAIYVVSYLAFGVPIVIAGEIVAPLGYLATVFWYSAATVVLALVSVRSQLRLRATAGYRSTTVPAVGSTFPSSSSR
jgi:MFS family permease